MDHIFISYSRKYQNSVTALAEVLRERGLTVWQDISGKGFGIPYSLKWFEVIKEAIFTASAAVIITSPEWYKSHVCKDEWFLIEETGLFTTVIPAAEIQDDEGRQNAADKIISDISKVGEDLIQMHTWALSGAFQLLNKRSPIILLPNVADSLKTFGKLTVLKESREYFEDNKTAEFKPEIRENIFRYIGLVKRRVISDFVRKVLTRVTAATLVITIVFGLFYFARYSAVSDDTARQGSVMAIAEETAKSDPISSMSLMTFDGVSANTARMRLLSELAAGIYPQDFIPAGDKVGELLSGSEGHRESSRFEITDSETSSVMNITDRQTGLRRSYALPQKHTVHCFDESGTVLAAAAGEKAFVMLPGAGSGCIELMYNHEEITDIRFGQDKVYLFTAGGNALVYDISSVKRPKSSRSFSDGTLRCTENGDIVVCTDGNDILLNADNTETVIHWEGNAPDPRFTAVSPDGQLAAVTSKTESKAAVISVKEGRIVKELTFPADICGICFDPSGTKLAAVSFADAGVITADISTGSTEVSEPGKGQGFSVCPFKDGYVTADSNGNVCVFDGSLRAKDLQAVTSGFCTPSKQLAVSEKYGFLFSANKGGGTVVGCSRTDLNNGSMNKLVPAKNSSYSSSSVCVSPDGEYAAYGYPDGAVRVWSAKGLDMLYVNREIPEEAIGLSFDGKGELAALGASGTLYRLKLNGAVTECGADQRIEQGKLLEKQVKEIFERMYQLGLTYITPDGYEL